MDRKSPAHIWFMRAVFCGLVLLILFFQLLPLETTPRKLAPPDLLMAFTFAWVLRRPDYVPIPLIAALFLLADLLLQRPPGLLAALVVAATAFLRSRGTGPGDTGFIGEWATVTIVLCGVALLDRLVLSLTLTGAPPLLLSGSQLILTIFAYPLAVGISHWLFGVRRPTRAEAEAMGAHA